MATPVLGHEPLRVSLEDLRAADTKGKWWLVGSAWSGDPLVDRPRTQHDEKKLESSREDPLLALARKQGMNTDVRRSIFIVLMTSTVSSRPSSIHTGSLKVGAPRRITWTLAID